MNGFKDLSDANFFCFRTGERWGGGGVAGEEAGGANSDDWRLERKPGTLYTLCAGVIHSKNLYRYSQT